MYRILGGDSKEYGPISADTIKQWMSEGRLSPQSQVRLEGSTEWKALSEFPGLLAGLRAGPAGTPQTPTPVPSSVPGAKTSGLAVTSVILGALGCAGLTAIGGLICGIVALGKINKSEGRQKGKGLAITGICLSGAMLLMAIPMLVMAGMLLPALSSAKSKAQSMACVNNLKQIGLGLRIYSMDHGETFPLDLLTMTNELGSPVVLVCPADPIHPRPASSSWLGFSTNQISYEYLTPGAAESNVVSQVVVRCPIHGSTCLGDGSVIRGNLSPPR